jgi:CBS domain containing-hemolysin-like protein
MTIKEALSYRKERLETVAKCYKNESLAVCMERIVRAEVHRLVVVDTDEHVIGVLSLSDLLYYIVIRPKTKSCTPSTTTTTTTMTTALPIPIINISADDDQSEVPLNINED